MDMKDINNCRKVTKGVDYVFNMACNMGGMGFIENNFKIAKRRKGDVDFLTCSVLKAKQKLGWKPIYSNIKNIIKDEIKWVNYLLRNKKYRKFKNYL